MISPSQPDAYTLWNGNNKDVQDVFGLLIAAHNKLMIVTDKYPTHELSVKATMLLYRIQDTVQSPFNETGAGSYDITTCANHLAG